MKKRTKILLIAGIALLCIVVSLCFTGILGIQTLYLPEKIEIVDVDAETGAYDRTGFIEYSYGSNGYLEKVHFRGWPTGTLSATCNISGNVTTLDDVRFIMLSDDHLASLQLSYTYSIRGQLTSSRIYRGIQTEYTYTSTGLLKQSVRTKTTDSGKLVTTTDYTYNLFEKCVSADSYTVLNDEPPKAATHTEYKYDAVGRLIQENRYNESNILTCQVEYRYENRNTIATKTEYTENKQTQTTCIFDHAGNLIEYRYGTNGQNVERYLYTYRKVIHFGLPRNSYSILPSLSETGISAVKISAYLVYIYDLF